MAAGAADEAAGELTAGDAAAELGADEAATELTAEDAALLDGADDTAAVEAAGAVESADDAVDEATRDVLVAADDDVAATPLSVPQPASSAQHVRVAARADRNRMDFLTVVEGRATLDDRPGCRQPAPIPRGGLIKPIRQATWLASGEHPGGPQLRDSAGFAPDFADGGQTCRTLCA